MSVNSFTLRRMVSIYSIYAVVLSLVIPVPRAPDDVTVERLNETHMMVSWSVLTPEKARGHLISYTIHYWPVSNMELVMTITIPPNTTGVVIGGLVPGEEYVVAVSATTGAGNGPMSSEVSTVEDDSQLGNNQWRPLFISIMMVVCVV